MKRILQDKRVKRAGWTVINSLMALMIASITFMATDQSVEWAIIVLPFAQAISQMITKEINTKYL